MKGKFGEGHVAAMGRLGLRELRNALNPSPQSVADNEHGLYGTSTQGEIADSRDPKKQSKQGSRGDNQESNFAAVSLDDIRAYAKELSDAQERGREQGKERSIEQDQERDRGGRER
jgi:hypothetical protein